MKRFTQELIGAIAITLILAASALAHEYKLGNLEIIHPHARATPPGAPVSGGFMVIKNTGTEPDRLIGGSADFSETFQVHEMKMDGDVMKMREIEGGLEIPAGGEVELVPGGYHVMFIGLKEPMVEGNKHKVTLTFEKAGSIEVEFDVENIAMGIKQGKMDGHGMQHGKKMGTGSGN